jgi:hypothetical protein
MEGIWTERSNSFYSRDHFRASLHRSSGRLDGRYIRGTLFSGDGVLYPCASRHCAIPPIQHLGTNSETTGDYR